MRFFGFHEGQNAQFNLTNHRLATTGVGCGKNPTLVIGHKMERWPCVGPSDSLRSNSEFEILGPHKKRNSCYCRARIYALYNMMEKWRPAVLKLSTSFYGLAKSLRKDRKCQFSQAGTTSLGFCTFFNFFSYQN